MKTTKRFKIGDKVVCIYDKSIKGTVTKENFVPAQPHIFEKECQFLYLNGSETPSIYTSEAFELETKGLDYKEQAMYTIGYLEGLFSLRGWLTEKQFKYYFHLHEQINQTPDLAIKEAFDAGIFGLKCS